MLNHNLPSLSVMVTSALSCVIVTDCAPVDCSLPKKVSSDSILVSSVMGMETVVDNSPAANTTGMALL